MMPLSKFFQPLPDIAFIAKARSGKDEAFKTLDRMGFDVHRVAFGDAMKEKFFELFPHIPREPKPVRELQKFNLLTTIDDQVWVRPTMNRAKLKKDILAQAGLQVPTLIYTDIRQQHEYDAVKATGAVFVRIETPLAVRMKRMIDAGEVVSTEVLNAPTETAMDAFEVDYTITNGGSREDFEKELSDLIYKIQEKRNGY